MDFALLGPRRRRAPLAALFALAALQGAAPVAPLETSARAAGGPSAPVGAVAAGAPAAAKPPAPVPAPAPPAASLVTPVAIPGGEGGIGFDDLTYVRDLHRLLVPGGRTGNLFLLDPGDSKLSPIGGFRAGEAGGTGHGAGTTSADFGRGWIFAIDRTGLRLEVVDPAAKTIVGGATLASSPDYVRFVAPTSELWVTEPDSDRIEIFALSAARPPIPAHGAFLAVPGGPEALAVDPARQRAYANLWKGATVAIDLRSREIVATWPNGCEGSRGLALDAERSHLFVGCAEGKAVVLDLEHGGAILDTYRHGSGVDIIAFSPERQRLYFPGGKSATLDILAVSPAGKLSLAATAPTAPRAHCVAVDERGVAWVCDPEKGRLLRVEAAEPKR